jgi:[protein-PII] uridylyltransferase
MKALVDRAVLDAQVAAAAEAHGCETVEFRKAAVAIFSSALERGTAVARAALEDKGSGLACGAHLAYLEDEILRAIHGCVVKYLHPKASGRLCVVAVGGYGRGALAPGSDIDVLFLLQGQNRASDEAVVESMLYFLWDLKQKVGHATRTVEECLKQAKADMTIRTTLLECRFLLGDRKLLDTLLARFDHEIVRLTAPEFVAAKLAERDQRIQRAGASRYLVEPNVKEGKGGLRDLNTLFWIAKYAYRVQDAEALVGVGLFSEQELRLFRRCETFLWKVRCHLHFLTGRPEERLSFDLQRAIAGKLGYSERDGLSAVERFMKHYFVMAKHVGDLTNIVCAALEERQAKPRAVFDRFVSRFKQRRGKPRDLGPFALETDRVTIPSNDIFEKSPINLIRLFYVAAHNELAIHPDALRLVTQSLPRIDAKLRADPEANRLFLEILTNPQSSERALRLMNEAGVLGRFIPDFGRIVALMQFNMYHHYTVDEHLLRAMGELAALELHLRDSDLPLSSAIMPTISHRRALYVALLLHDIAKGRKEDHSIAGAQVARKLCPRLGLDEAETETVAWLVEQHLIMSNIAQSRDLADPRTIEAFAKVVQSIERLKMLTILTVCDIRAVGPGVWNGWKGELLRTLYWETEVVLAGGHSSVDRKRRVEQAQMELREKLPAWSDPEFADYVARHYPAYWLKVDVAHKVQHALLLHASAVEMHSLATEVSTDAFRSVTELTVIAPDHPRLLSIIAGACAAAGANIVDAQIFTTTDGLALDTICISRAFERDEDEKRRGRRIARAIEQALRGEIRLSDQVAAKAGASASRGDTFTVPPDVVIDNSLSNMYSVVEVSGLDRPGLLFDLTFALSRLNLNIGSAHIVTFGEKAVDAFYVTDLTGAKVVDPTRQAAVRRQLLEVFNLLRKA